MRAEARRCSELVKRFGYVIDMNGHAPRKPRCRAEGSRGFVVLCGRWVGEHARPCTSNRPFGTDSPISVPDDGGWVFRVELEGGEQCRHVAAQLRIAIADQGAEVEPLGLGQLLRVLDARGEMIPGSTASIAPKGSSPSRRACSRARPTREYSRTCSLMERPTS